MSVPRTPYRASRGASVGVTERQINASSGVRIASFSGVISTMTDSIVDDQTPTDQATFTDLALRTEPALAFQSRHLLPMPCTPCITYRQTANPAPGGQTVQFRIRGENQFGQYIESIFPNVLIGLKANGAGVVTTSIWCPMVFARIFEVAYRATDTDALDRIDVGTFWQWDNDILLASVPAPTLQFHRTENQGIGIPLNISPYLGLNKSVDEPAQNIEVEVLSLVTVNLSNSNEVCHVQPGQVNASGAFRGGVVLGVNTAEAGASERNKFKLVHGTVAGAGILNINPILNTAGATAQFDTPADVILFHCQIRSALGTGALKGNQGFSPTYPR